MSDCVLDLSTGPTSITALLTADAISQFGGGQFTDSQIASSLAMMVGVYSLIVGLFKLGFLLDFVSVPALTGFISAAGITIGLGQVDNFLGLDNVGDGTANIIHDVLTQLNQVAPITAAIGFGSMAFLIILQWMGKRWGKKNKVIWALSISRAALVLVLFIGVSFAVNRNRRDDPLFSIAKLDVSGIALPRAPPTSLLSKVAGAAIAPFIAAALEHLAIGKGFGRKNNYVMDESQELVYLGTANFFNAFFLAQPVGGAMSRTAVNSESGVRSPLGGALTAGFVLFATFKLSPVLFWIPKATLSAIIIQAVWHIIDLKSFFKFFKTSFADFCASQVAFWVTLFVSTEMGIAASVGFAIVYTLGRVAFATITRVTDNSRYPAENMDISIPDDTKIFRFDQALLFPNAYRVKNKIIDEVQCYNSGDWATQQKALENRNWSVSGEKRIKELRAKAGVLNEPPMIRYVILDMSALGYIDQTGLQALSDMKEELRKYGGPRLQLRFVGMDDKLRRKFERGNWPLIDPETARYGLGQDMDVAYHSMTEAIYENRTAFPDDSNVEIEYVKEKV